MAVAAAGLLALAATGVAGGATPAENAAFAKRLKVSVAAAFKREARDLVLTRVTCAIPASGTVVRCVAHFSDSRAEATVVYEIKATVARSGTISWTTTSHSCTSILTHKTLAC